MKRTIVTMSKLFRYYIIVIISQVSRVFPIKKNRIVCNSYTAGRQYSDSPMYITEYLLNRYKNKYEIIWVFNEPEKFGYLKNKGIKIVKYRSLMDFYYSNSAKVYITNIFGPYPYVIKRRNRIIIETSHGVAYKKLFTSRFGDGTLDFFENCWIKSRINQCDYCLSGNGLTSDLVYRKSLHFEGKIIEKGLPRNDLFFDNNVVLKEKVKSNIGANSDDRIILFMPTWRADDSRKVLEIDYKRIVEILTKKDNKRWVVLLRLHNLSTVDITDILNDNKGIVIDVTHYPNPQELLIAADFLITDYSSVIWDFSLQGKPILTYTPDILTYNEQRGFNVSPNEWILFNSKNENELYSILDNNSLSEIAKASSKHLTKFKNFETGKSTEYVCKIIHDYCYT